MIVKSTLRFVTRSTWRRGAVLVRFVLLPRGGSLGLVCSVGLHLDLHHLEGVDDDGLSDPRAQAGQGVGLNTDR